MKYLCVLFFLITSSILTFGQEAPDISWEAELKNIPGSDTIFLVLKADVPQGLHIYSSDFQCDIGPNPTSFKELNIEGASQVGRLISVDPKTTYDDIFMCDLAYFDKKAELRQAFISSSKHKRIHGVLEFQVCLENGMCILQTHNFDLASE